MGLSLSEIEHRIQLHIERQKIITSNIADTDPPKYKVKDITFAKTLDHEVKQLAVAHEKHISGGPVHPEKL